MNEEQNIPEYSSKGEKKDTAQKENKGSQDQTIEQLQTHSENMEVHHHPHAERKNFKAYFT